MYEEDKILAEQCRRLARETTQAVSWLDTNAALVDNALESNKKTLRKAQRALAGCAAAAQRKMCVGVFGPSQAGKSYLVSTLAGNTEGKLWTTLDGKTCDFLSDINPAGGKESTGLVTRFTLTQPLPAPQGFPVFVRLLTVTDIAKILANTYFSDARHMEEPDRDAMLAKLADLEKRKQNSPTGGFSEDDAEELQEYVTHYFGDRARVQQLLDKNFWNRVIPLLPLLIDEDRAELLGLIWGEIEEFSAVFLNLTRVLRSFGYTTEGFCPITALLPREESIIDVEALSNLSTGDAPSIDISLTNGKQLSVSKVYIAALTAELVITMDQKPDDFFDHTDLLDFPGYRSRETFTNLAEKVKEPKNLELCFLRGKVEYLFQRYCAEKELTGLLLCIGPSVLEVKGLASAVDEWVRSTHGETAAAREGKETSLFFVLTKSDMEFENKAGVTDVSARWDIRIESSLIKSFAQHSQWPMQWTPTGTFRNLLVMRNPTIKMALFDHDAQNRETGIRPSETAYVAQFEKAFLESPHITSFCPCPREMWDSFMAPNDGGISLIRKRLAPICKPELKRAQIRTTVETILGGTTKMLDKYVKTDDKEALRKEKALLGAALAKNMLVLAQNQRFGQFLRLLMIRDQDIFDLYFRARHAMQEQLSSGDSTVAVTTVGPRFSADDMFNDLFGDAAPPAEESAVQETAGAGAALPKDEAEAFARQIEQYWVETLQSVGDSPACLEQFNFTPHDFTALVQEIETGFIRIGVRSKLEEKLRKASQYSNTSKERIVWRQASLAASIVNAYVDWLGFNPRLLDEKAREVSVGGKMRTLFVAPPVVPDLPELHEEPQPYDKTLYMDWASALMYLINENVNFDGVRNFDPEQNDKLKALLAALRLAPAV